MAGLGAQHNIWFMMSMEAAGCMTLLSQHLIGSGVQVAEPWFWLVSYSCSVYHLRYNATRMTYKQVTAASHHLLSSTAHRSNSP
jgi:hypothetical protein